MASATAPILLADGELHETLRTYVGARARDVDCGDATLRDGIAHLAALGVVDGGVYGRDTPESFLAMCATVGTVAMDCMSQAFSLWCHRMALEYLNQADAGSAVRARFLEPVRTGEVLGSTSFASATAHFLAGTPLTLSFRRGPDGLVVNGRIAWASNLQAPFVSIAAAVNEGDPSERVVFAYTEATPGLQLGHYPELLALQATSSASPLFVDARVHDNDILTRDFDPFVSRVLSTFLLLQSSFCWGLTVRAQAEAADLLDGPRVVLAPEYEDVRARLESAEQRLRSFALSEDRATIVPRNLLELRLDLGRLTGASVALESKLAGGRGYLLQSGTARRLREAAFVPVQSPTEVQLQWLLSRSA